MLPLENNTSWMDELASKISASLGRGEVSVYIGGEKITDFITRENGRITARSNGRA